MKRKLWISCLFLAIGTGCGPTDDEDAVDQAEEALASRPIVLRSADSKPLTIKVNVFDGVKEKTKNNRYIKVSAERGGESFDSFCDLRGDIDGGGAWTAIECETGVRTVSDDDNESLRFQIRKRQNAFELAEVFYAGDYTFLGKEANVLLNGEPDGAHRVVALTAQGALPTSIDKNPFVLGDRVHAALRGTVGESFYLANLGVSPKIKSPSFWRVASDMTLHPSFALGNGDRHEYLLESVSLLSRPGVLASGVATEATLASRVKRALPKR